MEDIMAEEIDQYNNVVCSVVIPVYEESSFLYQVFSEISNVVESLNISYELILVDDGSKDDTWEVIKKLAETNSSLRALRLSRNFGKEHALCAGLETAKGQAVIIMDGDLQHPPELIPKMIDVWKKTDVDLVEAFKEDRGSESVLNKLSARIFYFLLRKMSGYNLKGASDYKLLDRKVVNAWLKLPERSLFFRGMTAWLGFRKAEIFFVVPSRISGRSKWSLPSLIKLSISGITAFSSLPLHIVTFAGLFFLTLSGVIGVQAIFLKLSGKAVDGFTTVILLISLVGSLTLISLGLIGLYIARIYEEVKGRPRYVISEVIDNVKLNET